MWRCGSVAMTAVGATVLAILAIQGTYAYRVLMLTPLAVPSHRIFYGGIAKHLAGKNHSVTYVTSGPPYSESPNIKTIVKPEGDFSDALKNLFNTSTLDLLLVSNEYTHKKCYSILASEEIRKIEEEHFDLVIYGVANSECLLPVVHKLQAPFIYITPNALLGMMSDLAFNPHFSSLSVAYFLNLKHPLTFWGRMASTLFDTVCFFGADWNVVELETKCYKLNLCPKDMPSFSQLRVNASLMIVNGIKTLENPILPYTPTVVHAGGIQCHPSKPLPKELDEWANASGDAGFIYFSLGTLLRTRNMPKEKRSVLLKVFASLDQKILWKTEEDNIEGLPANVRISKWLPQQDILGHPRLRLFMTHGGLFSLQEATYHGIPILGFPVAIDQKHNLGKVVHEGWGKMLNWEDITYENLRQNILDIIINTSMREEVARRSRIIRDEPMSPGDWATYWIEYVIRHKGATHLRCPAFDMHWYELYNVDVWLTVLVVTLTILLISFFITYKTLKCIFTTCCRRKKNKTD